MGKKKILILGGTFHMVAVVETAKCLGYHTIVVDNMADSPAKKISDQSYDMSPADTYRLAEVGREEQIDGVFAAFDDVNTWHAIALCKTIHLPFYDMPAHGEITSHKDRFKDYCLTFGVPVIEQFECDSAQVQELTKIEFPVTINSIDSYAIKRMSMCYVKDELTTIV